MHVLGVDTATHRASVAVVADGRTLAESNVESRSHAASIVPLIDDLLREAGCTVEDLDVIAVSAGPGSFTGLRVGLSVAKGIACATGARVVGIPTLEALARVLPATAGAICPLLDARKGELYAACFERRVDGWMRHFNDRLVTPEQLLTALPDRCTILGDAVVRYGTFFAEHLGDRATVLPWPAYSPRASVVAGLAADRLRTGTACEGLSLEPFYVRASDAESRLG
jgi:tRNA threonylcarbamoyladenosine biosynthesis protein TsaB